MTDEKEAFERLFVAELRLFRRFPVAMHLLVAATVIGSVYVMAAYGGLWFAAIVCAVSVAFGAALEGMVRLRRRR